MELLYVGFIAFILVLLALDLGVFHRTAHVVSVREALKWSVLWIGLGLAFTVFIYYWYEHQHGDGGTAAIQYLTGFVVEKSLAIDNIFVIAMIFAFLRVPPVYQHRVLFWGIVGALLMRGAMIAIGAALLAKFTWIIYVFGGFLILTGVKMLVVKSAAASFDDNLLVRAVRRLVPVTDRYHGARFFVREGALLATPLLLALVLVEFTDVIFAVDSIPAIFAVTTDTFLVFTSNVFAILGLRSLYFALAGMIERFKYLKVSLSLVLMVIGVKMMAHGWLKDWLGVHFNLYVLAVVTTIIGAGVVVSLLATRKDRLAIHPV